MLILSVCETAQRQTSLATFLSRGNKEEGVPLDAQADPFPPVALVSLRINRNEDKNQSDAAKLIDRGGCVSSEHSLFIFGWLQRNV